MGKSLTPWVGKVSDHRAREVSDSMGGEDSYPMSREDSDSMGSVVSPLRCHGDLEPMV